MVVELRSSCIFVTASKPWLKAPFYNIASSTHNMKLCNIGLSTHTPLNSYILGQRHFKICIITYYCVITGLRSSRKIASVSHE